MRTTVALCSVALAVWPVVINGSDIIEFEMKPEGGKAFRFGAEMETVFTLKNMSSTAIVVREIAPRRRTVGRLLLESAATGFGPSLDGDSYRGGQSEPGDQEATFHGGLLLPGESLTVRDKYRPLSRYERFDISFLSADRAYDGTLHSMMPLRPYLKSRVSIGTAVEYVPFTADRWRELAVEGVAIRPGGSAQFQRTILLPKSDSARQLQTCGVDIDYDGVPFYMEDAETCVAKITGAAVGDAVLEYSSTLKAYFVIGRDHSWMLSSVSQEDEGDAMAVFPPVLLSDVDRHGDVRVQVGVMADFPEIEGKPVLFWGKYPIFTGEGMHKDSLFVAIGAKELTGFLKSVLENGRKIMPMSHFFKSRYYYLE